MPIRYYVAVLEPSADGYSVFFPDLPGCTSGGDTMQEALANAVEALAAHTEVTLEYGEPVPAPSNPDAPLPDWLEGVDLSGATRVLIPVDMPGKSARVNISIDEALLAAVDRAAASRGFTRSGFLAEAARRMLEYKGHAREEAPGA